MKYSDHVYSDHTQNIIFYENNNNTKKLYSFYQIDLDKII